MHPRSVLLAGFFLVAVIAGAWLLGTRSKAPLEVPVAQVQAEGDPASEPASRSTQTPVVSLEPAESQRTNIAAPDSSRTQPAIDPALASAIEDRRSIRGRVMDDAGAAVPRFEILCDAGGVSNSKLRSDWFYVPEHSHRFENEDGSFEVRGLKPGEWILTARLDSGTESGPTVVEVPQGDEPVVIVLPRAATIRGTVLSPEGAPVPEARVFAWLPGGQEPDLRTGFDPEPQARSDAWGRFQLVDVQPGDFRLLATCVGLCDSDWTEVAVLPGGSSEVVLQMRHGGRVVGRLDPSMGELGNREVNLYSGKGLTGWRETRTDPVGSFVFENVVPQRYAIALRQAASGSEPGSSPPEQMRMAISVEEGGTTEVLFAEQRGAIQVIGRVTCAGRPLSGVEVQAVSAEGTDDRERQVRTSTGGKFELDVKAPGSYRFWFLQAESFVVIERTVEDRAVCELDFELPAGTIAGVVLDPSGKPVANTGVTVLRAVEPGEDEQKSLPHRFRRTKTSSSGEFEFTMLPRGTYVLRTPDGFRGDSHPARTAHGRVVVNGLRVESGPADPQVIRLVPEGFIRGRVTDASGNPVGNALVRVCDRTGVSLSAFWDISTDVNGAFEVDSIGPGAYLLQARRQDVRGPEVPVEVHTGKTTQTVLRLP